MNEYIKNNKYSLLNIKVKYKWFLIISFITLLTMIMLMIFIKTYDSINYVGVIQDNKLVLNVNLKDVNKIIKSPYLKFDSKKEKFSIYSVGDILYDEKTLINYQRIVIEVDNNYVENLVVEVTFYNNKQRIITKLINLLK